MGVDRDGCVWICCDCGFCRVASLAVVVAELFLEIALDFFPGANNGLAVVLVVEDVV